MIYSCPAERLELEISGFNIRELELARGGFRPRFHRGLMAVFQSEAV